MSVLIVPATHANIEQIRRDLRMQDMAELLACDVDIARLPEQVMAHKVFAFCAADSLGPISVWGMVERRRGVGGGFAFGTRDWGRALLPMVRHIRGFVLPHLVRAGYHRVEAAALAHRDDVRRFMALIGAQPEGALRGFGRNKEDFISYRWLVDEHRCTQPEDHHACH